MLKKFDRTGNNLFDAHIKNNNKIYNRQFKNYRTYILENIVNVYEIRFEQPVLERLFGEKLTSSQRQSIIRDEVSEGDENN